MKKYLFLFFGIFTSMTTSLFAENAKYEECLKPIYKNWWQMLKTSNLSAKEINSNETMKSAKKKCHDDFVDDTSASTNQNDDSSS